MQKKKTLLEAFASYHIQLQMRKNEQGVEKHSMVKQKWSSVDGYLKVAYWYVGVPPATWTTGWTGMSTYHLPFNPQNTKGHDHGFVGWGQKAMIMAVFFWHFDFFPLNLNSLYAFY